MPLLPLLCVHPYPRSPHKTPRTSEIQVFVHSRSSKGQVGAIKVIEHSERTKFEQYLSVELADDLTLLDIVPRFGIKGVVRAGVCCGHRLCRGGWVHIQTWHRGGTVCAGSWWLQTGIAD